MGCGFIIGCIVGCNIVEFDSSMQQFGLTNNFMEQQIQNPAYIPNVHSHMNRNEA
jgi:hypothetical protein